jgi:diadenosine tetraphosphate (Ap4A) HIT family hydrolase
VAQVSNCCICRELGANGSTDVWNTPLFESRNFVVVPSLGALVPGWVLLLPKDHYLSMGALPSAMFGEMEEIKRAIVSHLASIYGELSAFEHGPSRAKQSVGCGVDHAHLHIVPVAFDLRGAVQPLLPPNLTWTEASFEERRQAFARGKDYLYLEQPLGKGRIAVHDHFGSQLFRRAIASHLGLDDEYNWRDYPQITNIMSTVESLQNLPEEKITNGMEFESVA